MPAIKFMNTSKVSSEDVPNNLKDVFYTKEEINKMIKSISSDIKVLKRNPLPNDTKILITKKKKTK